MSQKNTPHEVAELLVNWALDRAYKIAVHNVALTDWATASNEQKTRVYSQQMEIAGWLIKTVSDLMKK